MMFSVLSSSSGHRIFSPLSDQICSNFTFSFKEGALILSFTKHEQIEGEDSQGMLHNSAESRVALGTLAFVSCFYSNY